jgi:hypothetical protein
MKQTSMPEYFYVKRNVFRKLEYKIENKLQRNGYQDRRVDI